MSVPDQVIPDTDGADTHIVDAGDEDTDHTETEDVKTKEVAICVIVPQEWHKKVFAPNLLSSDARDFLDKHWQDGKLCRSGAINITKRISGVCVPFECLPNYVKAYVNKLTDDGELRRSDFKSKRSWETAQANLYLYGYSDDIEKALLQKRKAVLGYLRKWQRDHPERVKIASAKAAKYRARRRTELASQRALGNTMMSAIVST